MQELMLRVEDGGEREVSDMNFVCIREAAFAQRKVTTIIIF
jgi:hypothetical protein